LARLLAEDPLPDLLVLATDTAWEDARRAAGTAATHVHWFQVESNFADAGKILSLLHDLRWTAHGAALAVLRGGGDARSLDLWNDPEIVDALLMLERPFYTALGHSTNLLLADRYADEAFDTPTAFGSAARQIIEDRFRFERELEEMRKSGDALHRALGQSQAELALARASFQRALAAEQTEHARTRDGLVRQQADALRDPLPTPEESAVPLPDARITVPRLIGVAVIVLIGFLLVWVFR
jgi:exodeoxyribonuclease VII large subunit